jgi:hypothetical protein
MATYRFYVARTIGDGLSRATAFRSKLYEYLVNDGTQDFWSWSNRAWPRQFCLAFCDTTLHATMAADPDIVALSPELADVPAVSTWLDGPVGTLPAGIVTALENGGIPVDWVDGTTTRRQLWRFVSGWHFIVQRFSGSGDVDGFAFMQRNLDNTVSQVPVGARNRISAWMTANGIDSSWIVGATPVRAVVRFILVNGNFPIMGHGPVSF